MNRATRRLSQRKQEKEIIKGARLPWQPMRRVPKVEWPEYRGRSKPVGFWVNNKFTAIEYEGVETEFGGVRHLVIQRVGGSRVSRWASLQRVKYDVVGFDALAIELYPPEADTVNDCHAYHLWVLPEGYPLPGVGLDESVWRKKRIEKLE